MNRLGGSFNTSFLKLLAAAFLTSTLLIFLVLFAGAADEDSNRDSRRTERRTSAERRRDSGGRNTSDETRPPSTSDSGDRRGRDRDGGNTGGGTDGTGGTNGTGGGTDGTGGTNGTGGGTGGGGGTTPSGTYKVLGWNNLGMHCLDADFSVFSTLPPYNTIHAQIIDGRGLLVTLPGSIRVTYAGAADPLGSLNTTSVGKTNFWDYAEAYFGVALPVDVGLPVPGPASFAMPGAGNVPQDMEFETLFGWFAAYGIPIIPVDDLGQPNMYPLMRLTVRSDTAALGSSDIVLPVSDEMDCRACHASGSDPAAMPQAGWVFEGELQRDYRLNILRLHDEGALTTPLFRDALVSASYNTAGLYASVVTDNIPILCARCHLSEALPGSGLAGVAPLTQAIHTLHAEVIDPINHLPLESVAHRSACYRCHPGSETQCLRGAMGKAVAQDGTMRMQCQSCHGSMRMVGAANRTGWLDEPTCQNCHTGTAVRNNGQIRYDSVFDTNGQYRQALDLTYATNADAPAAGLSLYRFSTGHGGLYCMACHGSTHAEYPTMEQNDNLYSIKLQGHEGTLVDCQGCHVTTPRIADGGPHGLHPVDQRWIDEHTDAAEDRGAARCRDCHGTDYTGTELSQSQASRTFDAEDFGRKTFWRGYRIGCYTCHNGPNNESRNRNIAPLVDNDSIITAVNTQPAIPLIASDPENRPLTLRIVSQARHGTVALSGDVATYMPEPDYIGTDAFTFAAWDGQLDSNLGTVTISVVGGTARAVNIKPSSETASVFRQTGTISVTAAPGAEWKAVSGASWLTITNGADGTGNGRIVYSAAANESGVARSGTITIADQTFTLRQDARPAELTGSWSALATADGDRLCLGSFIVKNSGSVSTPWTRLATYLSTDGVLDSSDSLLDESPIGQINPGQMRQRPMELTAPKGTTFTGKYVIAHVDADGIVPHRRNDDGTVIFGPLP